jgi:hypothetical protein
MDELQQQSQETEKGPVTEGDPGPATEGAPRLQYQSQEMEKDPSTERTPELQYQSQGIKKDPATEEAAQLQRRIQNMEQRALDDKNQIEALKTEGNETQAKNAHLIEENKSLLEELQDRIQKTEKRALNDKEQIETLETKRNETQAKNAHLVEENKRLLKELQDRIQKMGKKASDDKEQIEALKTERNETEVKNSRLVLQRQHYAGEVERFMLAYRELLLEYNRELFKRRSNVWTAARIRPAVESDEGRALAKFRIISEGQGHDQIELDGPCQAEKGKTAEAKKFQFAKVFPLLSSNRDVLNHIEPMIQSAMSETNIVIIADGQSGAGKSFTMFEGKDNIAFEMAARIFAEIKLREDKGSPSGVRFSALELHNKNVRDLLCEEDQRGQRSLKPKISGKISTVPGLSEQNPSSLEELNASITQACRNREISSMADNAKSSRGHLVCAFTMWSQVPERTGPTEETKLYLVDLAGAERTSNTVTSEDSFIRTTRADLYSSVLNHGAKVGRGSTLVRILVIMTL